MKNSRFILLLAVLSQLVFSFARAGLPTPVTTVAPTVSEELASIPGEVELLITLNSHGYVTKAEVKSSTNPKLDRACLAAVRQWRYSEPPADGAAFIQPFRFGGDTIDTTTLAFTRPSPRSKVAPDLPKELTYISGEVTVSVAIGADGKVSNAAVVKSTHEELNALTLAAAKAWTFKPAMDKGQPVACNAYLPFHFTGTGEPPAKSEVVDNDKLIPIRQPAPVVPDNLAKLNGEVSVGITVNSNGYVVAAAVESTTNADLAEIARLAVMRWKFKPVTRDGVAVTVKAVQPFKFGEGTVSVEAVDQLPAVRRAIPPTLPAELEGVSGFANVVFDLDATGRVIKVTVAECSHEAFKTAVLAVAKDWIFKPAMRGGVATSARVTVPFVFGSSLASK